MVIKKAMEQGKHEMMADKLTSSELPDLIQDLSVEVFDEFKKGYRIIKFYMYKLDEMSRFIHDNLIDGYIHHTNYNIEHFCNKVVIYTKHCEEADENTELLEAKLKEIDEMIKDIIVIKDFVRILKKQTSRFDE